jgi:hypothetical protein
VKKPPTWSRFVLVLGVAFLGACGQQKMPITEQFHDEPTAHAPYAPYQQMLEALRKATTLSWTGEFRSHATYRIWLKKPNYVRLEAGGGWTQPSGISFRAKEDDALTPQLTASDTLPDALNPHKTLANIEV